MSLEIEPENKSQEIKDGVIPFPAGKLDDFIEALGDKFEQQTSTERLREDARTFVLKCLITMYSWGVLTIVFVGLVEVIAGKMEPMAGLKALVEFLSVLVLPIITLVLGFYFGSEKK